MSNLSNSIKCAEKKLASISDTSRLDAEILLMHVLKCSRAYLYSHSEDSLSETHEEKFDDLVERRSKGMPISYLTGEKEFWNLTLKITQDVLIPRPETERLVEEILNALPEKNITVMDLGTGSGAIALALAKERVDWNVLAVDVSEKALLIAKENEKINSILNVKFCCSNWFDDVPDMRCDVIVSNPPYICDDDPHLKQGDVRYEPRLALVAGDGLDAYRSIVESAERYLKPNGLIAFEHGHDQSQAISMLLENNGYADIVHHNDLSGHERVILARMP